MTPTSRDDNHIRSDVVRLDLPAGFRFVHEPLVDTETTVPLLGHEDIIQELALQLRFSRSGTFLVTGFRGVGKTTVVERAVRQHKQATVEEQHVLHVGLNVAKPIATGELLFAVIRRIFETLVEERLLEQLSDSAQRTLLLAYTRTSLQLAHTRSESAERSSTLSIGRGSVSGVLPAVLDAVLPKLDVGAKRTSSLAIEASFLTYSESDVEHDFVRIVEQLRRTPQPRRRLRLRRRPPTKPIQVVVVLDELDKLTSSATGANELETLLTGLKNVLTSGGAHFILVAGTDVSDRVAMDEMRGSGVYESVFSWQCYVPCLWRGPRLLIDRLLGSATSQWGPIPALIGLLEYRSRGITRRLFREFNHFVEWNNSAPTVSVSYGEYERALFFDHLRQVIGAHLALPDSDPVMTSLDEDRRRLAAYYVVDWIVHSGGRVFDVRDIMGRTPNDAVVDASLPLDENEVSTLLADLAGDGLLVERSPGDPGSTHLGSALSAGIPTYHLSDTALFRIRMVAGIGGRFGVRYTDGERVLTVDRVLARIAPDRREPLPQVGSDGDAAETEASTLRAEYGWNDVARSATAQLHGDYVLERLIGAGATGSVYKARDAVRGTTVAIKIVESGSALRDPNIRARLEREVGISAELSHPGLVRTLGLIEDSHNRVALVMEYIEGSTLASTTFPVQPASAVSWAVCLCETLQYLHERSIARIDLKPANIIIGDNGPVIVDLGLAKNILNDDGVVSVDGLVGTPAYMAPEQIEGRPPDIRADLYSLGVVTFEMLGGMHARPPLGDIPAILARTLYEDVPVDTLEVSFELRAVLKTATARCPRDRFGEPRTMATALRATPEAAAARTRPLPF